MREFRKKQKRLKIIMNTLCTITAIYFLVYIGIEPIAADWNNVATVVFGYIGDGLIIISLIILFNYFSKYSKSDKFLENIEYELSDDGYYITSRDENDVLSYTNTVIDDLKNNGFGINKNVDINDFTFEYTAYKKKEAVYISNVENVDKNDILAYLDSVIYDLTAINVRHSANAVLMFICDNAYKTAVALSKMITPLGKKENIKIAIAIVEISSKRVYFLGNKVTKCQQIIANYAMNCEVPIKDKYKGNERLPFQDELEEHMKEFNLKDFKDGAFFAH